MIDRSSFIENIVNLTSKLLFEKIKDKSITANSITILGAILGLIGCSIFFFGNSFYFKLISFILIYLYLVFDFIDGDIARYKNQTSNKGFFLDIFFDKLIFIFLIVILSSKVIIDDIDRFSLLLFLSFLPLFFQLNLVVFTNLKLKGLDINNWGNKNSNVNIKPNYLITIYRKFFFPTHINLVFIISLGLLFNLQLLTFYFAVITSLIAILRQFYIIVTKL